MRSAPNETGLSRLLTSAYEQLDAIKARYRKKKLVSIQFIEKFSYAQFYDMEHDIVNKYSNMIAEEVNRYKNEMLEYFHAREIHTNTNNNDKESSSSNINRQFYTTSLSGTTYELEGYSSNESDLTPKANNAIDDENENLTERSSADGRIRFRSVSYDLDQPHVQTFLTEDTTSVYDNRGIPFYRAFQIPSNLVQSIMFK